MIFVIEVPGIAARFSPFMFDYFFIWEHAIVVLGVLAGVALALWARRRWALPFRRAWGLVMAVFGMSVGLLLIYWSRALPDSCFDSGFRVGFVTLTPFGGCNLRWPELGDPDVTLLLGLVMLAGSGMAFAALVRSGLASSSSPEAAPRMFLGAAVLSLAWLAVEFNEGRYNLLALAPSLTYLGLARGAFRQRALHQHPAAETAAVSPAVPVPEPAPPDVQHAAPPVATPAVASPIAATPPVASVGAPFGPSAAGPDFIGDRPLTGQERDLLKVVGHLGKQITWLLGVGSLAFSAFTLIGLANGDNPENPEVLYGTFLALNLLGLIVGVTNRQVRSLASYALTRGTMSDTVAVPRTLGGRPAALDLGSAHLIPTTSTPGAKDQALAQAMESKTMVKIAYVGPFGPKSPRALLMAVNDKSLQKPVSCVWAPQVEEE